MRKKWLFNVLVVELLLMGSQIYFSIRNENMDGWMEGNLIYKINGNIILKLKIDKAQSFLEFIREKAQKINQMQYLRWLSYTNSELPT